MMHPTCLSKRKELRWMGEKDGDWWRGEGLRGMLERWQGMGAKVTPPSPWVGC